MNPLSQTAPRLTWLAGAFVVSFCALLGSIGADAHWLAALGGEIVELGKIPAGVPYAAAPSAGWENAPVLGELAFHGLEAALGDRGLLLALVGAVFLAVAALSLDMRRADAADAPSALVLLLVAVAAAQSLLIVRGQLFSLALFPVVLLILRDQARLPSQTIWVLPPLFALWSNLHGGVLVGIAVTGAYLLFHRLRRTPGTAIAVLVASLAAVLATPSLLDTRHYYRGVLGSEAATGHEGLWAPLSFDMPLDVAFFVAGVPLVLAALASRPRPWELVALAGLAVMTVQSGRNAVWLVVFAAVPAARFVTGKREWRIRPPAARHRGTCGDARRAGRGRPRARRCSSRRRPRATGTRRAGGGQRADPRRRHQRRGARSRRPSRVDLQSAGCLRPARSTALSRLDRGARVG